MIDFQPFGSNEMDYPKKLRSSLDMTSLEAKVELHLKMPTIKQISKTVQNFAIIFCGLVSLLKAFKMPH